MEDKPRRIPFGKLETVYHPLLNGGDIDITIFKISSNEIKKCGWSSPEEFVNYAVNEALEDEIIATQSYPESRDITNFDLTCAGYEIILVIDGVWYNYL